MAVVGQRSRSFRPLIKLAKEHNYGEPLKEEDLVGPTTSTRIWVEGVNGDGKLDILVGDNTTLISPATGLSREEFDTKRMEWEAKIAQVSKEMNDQKADEAARNKADEKFQQLYQEREKFMKEERTAFSGPWPSRQSITQTIQCSPSRFRHPLCSISGKND
jgi:hypothetical protein